MNKIIIPVLASVLILGIFSISPISFADDDDDDDDDNPCGIPQPPTGGSGGFGVSVGVYGTIAHPLDDDDDDDDDDARDDDDDDDDNPCPNTPPTIGSVSIIRTSDGVDVTNSGVEWNNELLCVANDVNDVDGDIVTLTFAWSLEGNVISIEEILPPFTASGIITCGVTPFDGTNFGDTVSAIVGVSAGGAGR